MRISLSIFLALIVAASMTVMTPVHAVQPDEILDDPDLESRARVISKDLRCLVCQNQSIDDSDAELARDLRLLVRERLLEGDSNEQVFDFVVARYGDYVLLRPPVKSTTYILWFAPFVIIVLAGTGVFFWLRGKGREQGYAMQTGSGAELSVEEEARLAELLGGSEIGSEIGSAKGREGGGNSNNSKNEKNERSGL